MNDAVRQELARIIERHGKSLADDPRRCEAMLRDYCGQYKREINVLAGALKERVAADLTSASGVLPVKLLIARLVKRLQENLGYSEAASKWAVESWALALGVVSTGELEEGTGSRAAVSRGADGPVDPDDPFIETAPKVSADSSPEEILRQALRIVFADGVATEYEKADLRRIRERVGLPTEVASRIFAEVNRERQQANQSTQHEPPPPTTLTVSQERGAQHESISHAIESARPGAHILVKPGVYRESLIINKPVWISGGGRAEEVIVESADSPCVVTRAAEIKIRGLTLRSFSDGEQDSYPAVDISFGRLIIEDCVISSNAGVCISIHGPGVSPQIRRCRVQDGGYYGIWVWDDAEGIIEECEISNCAGSGLVISGDTLEEARQMAAHILADIYGDQALIGRATAVSRGNVTSNSGTNGLPLVRRCDIFGNRDKGVWVHYKGRALIEHCRVFDNDAAGVCIDQGSEASIRHSEIRRNGWEAIRVTGSSVATVEDCDLSDNINGPWAVEPGSKLNKSGNKV